MATAKEHYDQLLGPIYEWMLGDPAELVERDWPELESVRRHRGDWAVDLGCGQGLHAEMLVAMDWSVVAVDSCEHLLTQLRTVARSMPIRVVHGDLTQFRDHLPEPAGLIICLGDTLTHLSSRQAANQLVEEAACALRPKGKLWLTFRDYTRHELIGTDRFIHVRGDDQQQLTCFLEYHPEFVRVHDILHRRGPDGWTMTSSCYDKLRLPPAEIVQQLTDLGLSADQTTTPTGMVSITALRR